MVLHIVLFNCSFFQSLSIFQYTHKLYWNIYVSFFVLYIPYIILYCMKNQEAINIYLKLMLIEDIFPISLRNRI